MNTELIYLSKLAMKANDGKYINNFLGHNPNNTCIRIPV